MNLTKYYLAVQCSSCLETKQHFYLLILDPTPLITNTAHFSDLSVHSGGCWSRQNPIPTSRHRFQSNGTTDNRRSAAHNGNAGSTSDRSFPGASQPHRPDRPPRITSRSNRSPSHRHRLQPRFHRTGTFLSATWKPPAWISPPWWRSHSSIRLPADGSPPWNPCLPPVKHNINEGLLQISG